MVEKCKIKNIIGKNWTYNLKNDVFIAEFCARDMTVSDPDPTCQVVTDRDRDLSFQVISDPDPN